MLLAWDRPLFGYFEERILASSMFYFCIAFSLRCGWIPFTVIAGTVLGLASDPMVKGGTHESMMWETVRHIAGGTAIGLLVGFVLDAIPTTRRIPKNHMR
jgi:hypothetical protein